MKTQKELQDENIYFGQYIPRYNEECNRLYQLYQLEQEQKEKSKNAIKKCDEALDFIKEQKKNIKNEIKVSNIFVNFAPWYDMIESIANNEITDNDMIIAIAQEYELFEENVILLRKKIKKDVRNCKEYMLGDDTYYSACDDVCYV